MEVKNKNTMRYLLGFGSLFLGAFYIVSMLRWGGMAYQHPLTLLFTIPALTFFVGAYIFVEEEL